MLAQHDLLYPHARLSGVTTGGAPTSAATLTFLHELFPFSVSHSYGTTEIGGITSDGRVEHDIELELRDVPALGYFACNGVGEVLVRKKASTDHDDASDKHPAHFAGYARGVQPEPSNADSHVNDVEKDDTGCLDARGFYCTGDVGRVEVCNGPLCTHATECNVASDRQK